jgi:hypothetical protein
MYDKVIEIVQTKLDSGDYKMKCTETAFGSFPEFRFTFRVSHFHYIRVQFKTCITYKSRYFHIYNPDDFVIRAGFRKERIDIDKMSKQMRQMEQILIRHIYDEWNEIDRKKDTRVKIIINKLYNLWKSKHDS